MSLTHTLRGPLWGGRGRSRLEWRCLLNKVKGGMGVQVVRTNGQGCMVPMGCLVKAISRVRDV